MMLPADLQGAAPVEGPALRTRAATPGVAMRAHAAVLLALAGSLGAQQMGNAQRDYTINGGGGAQSSLVPTDVTVGSIVLNRYQTQSPLAPCVWIASPTATIGWYQTATNSVDIGPQNLVLLVNAYDPQDPFSGVFHTSAAGQILWPAPVPGSALGSIHHFATAHGSAASPDGFFISQTHRVTVTPEPTLAPGIATCNASGMPVALDDDDSILVNLGFALTYYGVAYTQAWLGSNGFVTFQTGDTAFQESVVQFLSGPPRIAILWDDFAPNVAPGSVRWHASATGAEACFVNVPEYPATGSNSFRLSLANGQIHFDYGTLTCTDGLVGLSPGGSLAQGYAVNLSAAPHLLNYDPMLLHAPYQLFGPGQLDLATRRVTWILDASGRPIMQN
jgi:hypothetical protein